MTPSAEILYDLSMDDYLGNTRMGSHNLTMFRERGPRAFIMRQERMFVDDDDTDAKRFGRMFEDIAQGREIDFSKFIVKPLDLSFATAEGKLWREQQVNNKVKNQDDFTRQLSAIGKELIEQKSLDAMRYMHDSFLENERAMDAIRRATKQATIFASDAPFGLKSRPDYLIGRTTVDLKTCMLLNAISNGTDVRKRNYHVQAALARMLLRRCVMGATAHYLLAVEKVMPFRCQLVRVTEPWLDAGDAYIAETRAQIAYCQDTGMWPRVRHEEVELPPPPAWMAA